MKGAADIFQKDKHGFFHLIIAKQVCSKITTQSMDNLILQC